MTDREKALSITGYVGLMRLRENLSSRVGGQLASLGAEYAGIPVELVARARDEGEAFTKIATLALRWPVVGRWLARRAIGKAQTRGVFSMTDREKALVLDNVGRWTEQRTKMPHSEAVEMVTRSAWKVGIEYELVAQVSQESTAFIVELAAAIQAARDVPGKGKS